MYTRGEVGEEESDEIFTLIFLRAVRRPRSRLGLVEEDCECRQP